MTDGYRVWDQLFRANRRAKEYEGLTRKAAEELARANSVRAIRVDDWDNPTRMAFTADLRPTRLNLLVHHGRVARAGFG